MQPGHTILIGVDVGGTFTDLVAWDGAGLRIVKVPSTPPDFQTGILNALGRAMPGDAACTLIHGSTVATNALLQRAGAPAAFITTEGFRDMLLIGRQNRPELYALHVRRPEPIVPESNWFTVRERIGPAGNIIQPLDMAEVDRLIDALRDKGLCDAAVCLLFSFANPLHERLIGERLRAAGLTVSLSSDILPEFREYERASTTAINASLGPVVRKYLHALRAGLPSQVRDMRIMHSGGGTIDVDEAERSAARLVLSGPAGGVLGAAFVAEQTGHRNLITYDMGGTSTDVAAILDGKPQWTNQTRIDGLPIALPMFDIHTIGAGGGSIAQLDAGGALRVGPRSAGAIPGPACYGRGGTAPTVTDANVVLGRILSDRFLGGNMQLDPALAHNAVAALAAKMNTTVEKTAAGILRVVESNMAAALRAVSSQRGHDPRDFALLSFGGAGGLHACALADLLDMPTVLIPPYCGVLSALGMAAAATVVDVSRTVIQHATRLDDAAIDSVYAQLETQSRRIIAEPHLIERYADVRFAGQSHEVRIAVSESSQQEIERAFLAEYQRLFGQLPTARSVEIVTLRVRMIGRRADFDLPKLSRSQRAARTGAKNDGSLRVIERADLLNQPACAGPLLIVDDEATTFVPGGWRANVDEVGMIVLTRR